jgi:hypothetical protein
MVEIVAHCPYANRENRREDVDVEDDEARDFLFENKTRGKIDKAQIEEKPIETIRQDEAYLLKKWRIIAKLVESLCPEDDSPERDS